METVRKRIDREFEAWGVFVVRHRVTALLLMLCLTAAFAVYLPSLALETSNESYFRPNDPALKDFEAFRAKFGREDWMIAAVTPEAVFDRGFLEKLKAFHAALEQRVPYVSEVLSLVNVRHMQGRGDTLVVDDLLETLPASPAGMETLRERVLSSQLYRNYLISGDGRTVAVLVEPLAFSPGAADDALSAGFAASAIDPAIEGTGPAPEPPAPLTAAQNRAVLEGVRAVAADFNGPDFPVSLGGGPVFEAFFKEAMTRDLAVFSSLAVLTIGLLLFLLFRNLYGAVLPLAVVGLSLLATLGLMAACGVPFTLPTTILPSFLLAVGVGDSVHLLAMFLRHLRLHADKRGAVVGALGHSGLPILMTSLTTAAGLFAFATSGMAPIAHLGIFAGTGVMAALLYTLVLLPALLAILPPPRHAGHDRPRLRFDAVLAGIADFAVNRAWAIVTVSALLAAISLAGLTRLHFSVNFLAWLPRDLAVRRNIERIDRELKGSVPLEIVVDTGRDDGLVRPEVLNSIDALALHAEAYRDKEGRRLIGKALSVVDVVKETNRALNEGRPDFYAIPQRQALIAQELLLFESSRGGDLQQLVDRRFSKARLTLVAPFRDASVYVDFVTDIGREARNRFGQGVKVVVTGTMNLFTGMLHRMMLSMAESYAIAAVVITAMMIVLIGSLRLGLVTMLVNFSPILFTLGCVMGFAGIRLDISTLLLGSIALGLAVDDTIHFFHNFRRYYGEHPDVAYAVRETLVTSGRAMLFTTLILVSGFWLFMFATLKNNFYFGLLTGITLIVALAADFLLAPALLALIVRTRTGARICARWSGLHTTP